MNKKDHVTSGGNCLSERAPVCSEDLHCRTDSVSSLAEKPHADISWLSDDELHRVLSLAGLCRRAGGVIPGSEAVISALQRRGTPLPCAIMLSSDASARTIKNVYNKAVGRAVNVYMPGFDSYEAGHALGTRSPIAVFALTGRGPAEPLCAAVIATVVRPDHVNKLIIK